METQHEQTQENTTEEAAGKDMRTFLYAFITLPNGEKDFVGPFSKPELRQELAKLGDVEIHRMVRGREQKFATKAIIQFQ